MFHIGNIINSNKNNPIVKLYQQNEAYYILDVVMSTKFQEYYAYEVSKENIRKFIETERNEHLLPNKNQLIYRVHFFDFNIYNIQKYKKSLSFHLSLSDDEFECCDINKITKHLNFKNNRVCTKV